MERELEVGVGRAYETPVKGKGAKEDRNTRGRM